MIKRISVTTLCCAICLTLLSAKQSNENKKDTYAARELIYRVSGKEVPVALNLKKCSKTETTEKYFEYRFKNDTLYIQGNTNVALCRGYYDFIKSNHCGMYTWSGNNIKFPQNIEVDSKRVVSPFEHHYFFNVVTFGYSTPYWDWARWEKEIDRMALQGIDMPLALVAYEAIIARVWKKMGLTDKEINDYFVGAAHLPWMRMGNISGIDSPLNEDWHNKQIALQHKILDRMRELGMEPICHGFPGFIPEAFKRIYPNLNIIKTSWGGAFHNFMISPNDPLFSKMGTAYIKEFEKEFGKNTYYLVDSFNEMDLPFPDKGTKERKELLSSYGQKVYQSIKNGNPKAIWTMQGWMFGYQRNIWDYESLKALLSKVPDNKMLLLDLAVDYNKHFWHSEVNWEFYKGFYDKKWVYSVIPNMGGKTGLTGILDFYLNGHIEALESENKGNLTAHGSAPEGIENNEVIYEILGDAGWSDKHINITQWLEDYSINRYGSCPKEISTMWAELLKSVYGTFTDHPRYNWQFRPGTVKNGSINIAPSFFKGIESFVSIADSMQNSPLYLADLAEFTALYLGGKAEILLNNIEEMYHVGDIKQAEKSEKDFEYILKSIDRLLLTHPTLSLERWINYAHKQAENSEQKKQYERNAKRIVTIWGPPVDDYSARVWSGLVRDYYLPRWQHYFESKKSGQRFDFVAWETNWVENSIGLSEAVAPVDIIKEAKEMICFASGIKKQFIDKNLSYVWSLKSNKEEEFDFHISVAQMEKMSEIIIMLTDESSIITINYLKITADGATIINEKEPITLDSKQKSHTYKLKIPNNVRANNGGKLTIMLKNNTEKTSEGVIIVR